MKTEFDVWNSDPEEVFDLEYALERKIVVKID